MFSSEVLVNDHSLVKTVCVAILINIVIRQIYYIFCGPLSSIPGPFHTRFTSLSLTIAGFKGERVSYVHALHEKYGPIVRITPDQVSVADLEAVKEIHRVAKPYLKSKWYLNFVNSKPMMFTMRNPLEHRARRSLLAHPMSESGLKSMEPIVNRNIRLMIDGLSKEGSESGPVDVFKWFVFMASDNIGELSFGESFKMLERAKPNQYFEDFKAIGFLTSIRMGLGPLVYLLGALRIKPFSDTFGITQRLIGYAQQSLARYRKLAEQDPDNLKPTLFTKLFLKGSDGQLSEEQLIGQGVDYIVAGSETTAVTLSFLIYTLTQRPDIRSRLIEEISHLPETFGWSDLHNLSYLNNVIDETLRLYNSIPGLLPREVPPNGATLAGHFIPEGAIVSTQSYSLHRDPHAFPDPETFDPDRWNKPTHEMMHAYMPFGGGPRTCIGMHLAKNQLRYATALFVRRFPDAQYVGDHDDMKQWSYFLMGPKGHQCLLELNEKRN